MQRPNVLILYTDQQRWDTLGAGGNDLIHTPNLDALAGRGVLFDNAFVNCPVCMPSRMSMLSGQYPSSVGVCSNGCEMPPEIPCLHNILALYGYHTANIGKLHFRNHASAYRDHREPHPPYGFDTLILSDEPGCYDDAYIKWVEQLDPAQVPNCRVGLPPASTGRRYEAPPRVATEPYVFAGPEHLTHSAFVADEVVDYLRRHREGPFVCIAGFYAPHSPINPPARFVEMYDPDAMPLPARNAGENMQEVPDAQWRKIKAYYYAQISHIDDQIGRILNELGAQGLAENTLVLFTADHGENLGDRGRMGKGNPEDSSSRVPLIVSYPAGFSMRGRRAELIEHVDLAPTLLDWCGVQVPPFMQGRSFRALLEGGPYTPRDSAFMELRDPFRSSYKAVRTHTHLYRLDRNNGEWLYALESDPQQLRNVAEDPAHAAGLHHMRKTLLERWFDVEKQSPKRTGAY
ncbi:MAG: sulfatase-like hydrolase/transferase [Kiritimatiellae bacterium]|nr:sulfatase-like hydrolase/transferase [Kiritimatiellia bacterium]